MEKDQHELPTATAVEPVISAEALLDHWQGHRRLTRRLIEAFPEDQFFTYSIGGMRPFAAMVMELLGMGAPGVRGVATAAWEPLDEHREHGNSKAKVLRLWDEATEQINHYWSQIPAGRFQEVVLAFGQYEDKAIATLLYFIDNEIHHRGQAYVYLRSLGIAPPAFWER